MRAFILLFLLTLISLLAINTTQNVTPRLAIGHYFAASFPYSISLYYPGPNPTYYKISPLDDYLLMGPTKDVAHFLSWDEKNQNEEVRREAFWPYKAWQLIKSQLFNQPHVAFTKQGDMSVSYEARQTAPNTLVITKKITGLTTPAWGLASLFAYGASDQVEQTPTNITITNPRVAGKIVIPVNSFDKVTLDEAYKVVKIESGFGRPQTEINLTEIIYVY